MRSVFCGRERELAYLGEAWRSVAVGGGPRLEVLLGESGVGKSRLVQEFYDGLAAAHRSETGEGYWPVPMGVAGETLVVNPSLERVDVSQVMPFMWWGSRLLRPDVRNAVPGRSVEESWVDLRPHLRYLERGARVRRQWIRAGRTLAELALSFLPGVDKLVGVGQALEAWEAAWRALRAEGGRRGLREEAEGARSDVIEEVVSALTLLMRETEERAPVPMVWWVDDAQFSQSDAGLVALFERVLREAWVGGWPLLVLVTCWRNVSIGCCRFGAVSSHQRNGARLTYRRAFRRRRDDGRQTVGGPAVLG